MLEYLFYWIFDLHFKNMLIVYGPIFLILKLKPKPKPCRYIKFYINTSNVT